MVYALSPQRFLRSLDASRATLGKPPMKLLDIVAKVGTLTRGAPYAVVGGLAQILWARKTHTDDLDIALCAADLAAAHARVGDGGANRSWSLPTAPDRAHEHEVVHLLYDGVVVDMLTFRDEVFTAEILDTAVTVSEPRDIRFIRPELLLVTHLLRPGARAALAAIELVLARREAAALDVAYTERWARRLHKEVALMRTLRRADEMELG